MLNAYDDDDVDFIVCTSAIDDRILTDEAAGSGTAGAIILPKKVVGSKQGRKNIWPSMELQVDENHAYETSHIIVTTDDTYTEAERFFILACIHCELYIGQKPAAARPLESPPPNANQWSSVIDVE